MNTVLAGLLSLAVLASHWLPVGFVFYVFCERQFTLRVLFVGVTVMATAIGTLVLVHRLVY